MLENPHPTPPFLQGKGVSGARRQRIVSLRIWGWARGGRRRPCGLARGWCSRHCPRGRRFPSWGRRGCGRFARTNSGWLGGRRGGGWGGRKGVWWGGGGGGGGGGGVFRRCGVGRWGGT